jgi:hypothetical protein
MGHNDHPGQENVPYVERSWSGVEVTILKHGVEDGT